MILKAFSGNILVSREWMKQYIFFCTYLALLDFHFRPKPQWSSNSIAFWTYKKQILSREMLRKLQIDILLRWAEAQWHPKHKLVNFKSSHYKKCHYFVFNQGSTNMVRLHRKLGNLQIKALVAARPLIGTLRYFQVLRFWFASTETAKVSLKVRGVGNQQKNRTHIEDRDGNTRLVEHDQLYLFAEEWERKLTYQKQMEEKISITRPRHHT